MCRLFPGASLVGKDGDYKKIYKCIRWRFVFHVSQPSRIQKNKIARQSGQTFMVSYRFKGNIKETYPPHPPDLLFGIR